MLHYYFWGEISTCSSETNNANIIGIHVRPAFEQISDQHIEQLALTHLTAVYMPAPPVAPNRSLPTNALILARTFNFLVIITSVNMSWLTTGKVRFEVNEYHREFIHQIDSLTTCLRVIIKVYHTSLSWTYFIFLLDYFVKIGISQKYAIAYRRLTYMNLIYF